jgi:VWFA-related protein
MLYGVQQLRYGDTALFDASFAGLMLAESESERPLLIIFSDGMDTISWLPDAEVLESAKQTHAVVYAVSTRQQKPKSSRRDLIDKEGESLSYAFLRGLTKFAGGSSIIVENSKNLGDAFRQILEEFRKRYLITYIPRGVSESGWHELKVQVKKHSSQVVHRPGYLQEPTSLQK